MVSRFQPAIPVQISAGVDKPIPRVTVPLGVLGEAITVPILSR
jgi:hypothetical protein